MKYIAVILLSGLLSGVLTEQAWGHRHEKGGHRQHKAHQHGAGQLGIAFEAANGKIDFKSPSESVFGFEHEAKTEKDQKAQQEGLQKLEANIADIVVFDSSLNCKMTKEKVEVVREEEKESDHAHQHKHSHKHKHAEHSETVAVFNVKCDKSPAGTDITFNFQKHFPRLKKVNVQVIADSVQKSADASKNGTKVSLK